jgi:hypothetical protein
MIWVWTIFSITFALAESTVRKKRSDWVAKTKILDAYDARKANFEFTGTQVPDWRLVTTKTHYIYFLRTHTTWSIEVWVAQARDWPAIKRQLDRSTRTSLNGAIEISRFHRLRTISRHAAKSHSNCQYRKPATGDSLQKDFSDWWCR